jgi:hypothetical protein
MLVIVMSVATSMFVRPARAGALILTICKHHRTTCGIPPALSTEGPDLFNCQRRVDRSPEVLDQGRNVRRVDREGQPPCAPAAKPVAHRVRMKSACARMRPSDPAMGTKWAHSPDAGDFDGQLPRRGPG